CPVSFEIGEDIKVAVISVTEGDDKPAKYPSAIRKASALVITKTDLSPYINCNIDRMEQDALEINPDLKIFRTAIHDEQSMDPVFEWIESLIAQDTSS
ncbi:hydrogenase accessory protein HypB, partial [bacterium]|nr:hydrogenase accessory protein HypB [bacterium]